MPDQRTLGQLPDYIGFALRVSRRHPAEVVGASADSRMSGRLQRSASGEAAVTVEDLKRILHSQGMSEIRPELARGIRLWIQEQRNERKSGQELDARATKRHEEPHAPLKRSWAAGGNGKH